MVGRINQAKLVVFLSLSMLILVAAPTEFEVFAAGKNDTSLDVSIGAPKSLDPVHTTSSSTRIIMRNVYDYLFAWDSEGYVKPMMVESWSVSEDVRTYKFTLRRGLKFHNGSTVTTEDVIASLLRWSKKDRWGKKIFETLETIEAIDAYSFMIKLKQPNSFLPKALGKPSSPLPVIIPKKLAVTPPDKPITDFIGSGPFRFVEWKPGQHVILERFDGYLPRDEKPDGFAGGKHAKVERLIFHAIPDLSTSVAALETGQIDIVDNVSYDQLERIKANPDLHADIIMPHQCSALVFNKRSPIFGKVKMRKAVQTAADCEEIMNLITGDKSFYRLGPSIFFENSVFSSNAGAENYNQNNLAKAEALIAEAGGIPQEPVRLLVSTSTGYYNQGLAVKNLLEKIGFKVDFQVMEWGSLSTKRYKEKEWDAFTGGFTFVSNSSPNTAAWLNPAWAGWYDSPRMKVLLNKFMATSDLAAQQEITDKIQAVYYDEVPILRYGELGFARAYRKTVTGLLKTGEAVFWNIALQGN